MYYTFGRFDALHQSFLVLTTSIIFFRSAPSHRAAPVPSKPPTFDFQWPTPYTLQPCCLITLRGLHCPTLPKTQIEPVAILSKSSVQIKSLKSLHTFAFWKYCLWFTFVIPFKMTEKLKNVYPILKPCCNFFYIILHRHITQQCYPIPIMFMDLTRNKILRVIQWSILN